LPSSTALHVIVSTNNYLIAIFCLRMHGRKSFFLCIGIFLLKERHLEDTFRTAGNGNPVSGTQSEVMVMVGAGALHRGHSSSHPGVGHTADGVVC
jgi:hypothetical protein